MLPPLADAPPAFAFDALHQVLIGALVSAGSVIAFLFYRLEASREKLYQDARADAATDAKMAEAMAAVSKELSRINPAGGRT